jgi:hypothetical protein
MSDERMRIIGLEETIALPSLLSAWKRAGVPTIPQLGFGDAPVARRLRGHGEQRLADMDAQGIDVAVLSSASPGVHNLGAVEAVAVARDTNDELAAVVASNPDRYEALAVLPTADPAAAAAELERAVTVLGLPGAMVYGRTGSVHADSRAFDDLYAVAARLGVPLHFHPQVPQQAVIDAYYSDLDGTAEVGPGVSVPVGFGLATAGIGWYYETGVEFLRMILSGVFDRHPGLQVIAGHSGEVVLFYADHTGSLAAIANIERPLIDYFKENFWVTGSGTVSPRFQRWTAELVGTDRMLYATDYPYTFDNRPGGYRLLDTGSGVGRSHLEDAPFTDEEKAAIGHGNWERLKSRAAR